MAFRINRCCRPTFRWLCDCRWPFSMARSSHNWGLLFLTRFHGVALEHDASRAFVARDADREVPYGLIRWSGYMDGRYLTTDLTPSVLRAAYVVGSNDLYQDYMLRGWWPLLLNPERVEKGSSQVVLTEAALAADLADIYAIGDGTVSQTHYGINDVAYQVSLKEERLLLENEMYFPGWQARLNTPDARVIDAVAVNGVFRAWLLPAGDYTMVAHFEFPHLLALRLACGTSLLIWLCVWFVRFKGWRLWG